MVTTAVCRSASVRAGNLARAYLVTALALLAAYPFLPSGARDAVFLFMAWSTVVPVVIGLRRTARPDRAAWWLILAALLLGSVAATVRRWPGGEPTAIQMIPGLDASAAALMFAAAVAVIIRRGRNDLGGLIDTTIVSLSLGGLLWSLLVLPRLGGSTLNTKTSLFITVVVLSGVFGALVRLLETDTERFRPLRLLLAALTLNLAGIVLHVAWTEPPAMVVARMLFIAAYIALGQFGLGRSAGTLMRPGTTPSDVLGTGRLVFLGAALAAVPLIAGGRAMLGYPTDGWFLAIGSVLLTPLVMLRVGLLSAERDRTELALRHLAAHDPLTGVLNRREFTHRLAAELDAARDCALVFVDLDGFKTINDHLGHPAGDRVLIEVSRRLLDSVRDRDEVGRFGGDEFLVLFRDAGADEVARICARIDEVLRQPFVDGFSTQVISASIGAVISDSGRRAQCADSMILQADQAMYAAKQASCGLAPLSVAGAGPADNGVARTSFEEASPGDHASRMGG